MLESFSYLDEGLLREGGCRVVLAQGDDRALEGRDGGDHVLLLRHELRALLRADLGGLLEGLAVLSYLYPYKKCTFIPISGVPESGSDF